MVSHQDIMDKLIHSGASFRANGIFECVKYHVISFDIVEQLKKLKDDQVMVIGWTVSQCAIAALDVLKVEKYSGEDPHVLSLIDGFKSLGDRSAELKSIVYQ